MKATLKGKVEVSRWAAFAELAWMEPRIEIGLLCKRAMDRRAPISPDLIQGMIPGLPPTGAASIISQLKMLGVCDGAGALSALGREAAKDNMVPIPEQGTYELWIAEHPICGCRLAHAKRLDSKADERRGGPEAVAITKSPQAGVSTPSVVDPKDRIVFRSFPRTGGDPLGSRRNDTSQLQIQWEIDTKLGVSRWAFQGTLDIPGTGQRSVISSVQEKEFDIPWLADHWGNGVLAPFGSWNDGGKFLQIDADEASLPEKRAFQKNFGPLDLDVPGIASFTGVTLSSVAIAPANSQEAQAWATDMLYDALATRGEYITREQVRSVFAEQVEGTPLQDFEVALESHATLLSDLGGEQGLFWQLAAPVDLSPHPVSRDVLDKITLGGRGASAVRRSPRRDVDETRQVSVLLGERFSMGDFLGRFMSGPPPKRLLLSDRHVRGERALVLLKALVEVVKAANHNCQIDVWTDDPSESDQIEIARLTGRPPRSYKDVYGHARPHDRYLLIADSSNRKHAWQLTNSLLSPSWDRAVGDPNSSTPLRWKDLLAVRRQPEEISVEIARWFDGGNQ